MKPRALYGFVNRGELAAFRFGRVIRVRESDLEAFIEACRIEPGAEQGAERQGQRRVQRSQ